MMMQNPEFLLLLPLMLYTFHIILKRNVYGKKLALSRLAIVLLLILAATSPAITQQKEASIDQKLGILVDNTTSMEAVQEADISIGGRERVFIEGNSTNIFSQATSSIEPGTENLLVTDGQTDESADTLIEEAENRNASVSVYSLESREEAAIKINGPSTTVPGAENSFTVDVSSATDQPVTVTVRMDNEQIFSGQINQSYSFARTFDETGEHRIRAEIQTGDRIEANNQYYKTVKVREKPKILSIGDRGSLDEELSQFYQVENRQTVPDDLSSYYSVIAKKPVENAELTSYLAEGNGLMYTGSLEDSVPSYLPVRRSQEDEGEAGARVIILIDSSEATGGECVRGSESFCVERSASGGVGKESIQIAYSLVDGLDQNNQVGVVAYSGESYLVSKPRSLAFNRETIKERISRITPEGPSFHDLGLKGASSLAESNDTVVMLTDGNIGTYNRQNIASKTRSQALRMQSKLITVGMGDDPNRQLLEGIAEQTGGYYLENDEAGRLNFQFGSGGGDSEYTPLAVVNPNHFITEGVEIDGSTTGFSQVDTKRSAQNLVSSSEGQEVLSTWRYGLGRVAAFSAGDENMGRLSNSDPELISRTVSWTVGSPQRKKNNWKNVEDAARPEKPEARSSNQIQGLTQRSENIYTAEIDVDNLGFHNWKNETYAYNYNPEKESVGQDMDKLQKIAQETGGRIYNSENIGELPQKLDQVDRSVTQRVSLAPYLIIVALLVFLAEVGYRKRNGRL